MTWDIFSMVTHMWALLLWQADDHGHTCRWYCRWYWSLTYLAVITCLIQWLLVGWSRLDPRVSGCIHESRRIVDFFTMSKENTWVYLIHSYIYIKISYSSSIFVQVSALFNIFCPYYQTFPQFLQSSLGLNSQVDLPGRAYECSILWVLSD